MDILCVGFVGVSDIGFNVGGRGTVGGNTLDQCCTCDQNQDSKDYDTKENDCGESDYRGV